MLTTLCNCPQFLFLKDHSGYQWRLDDECSVSMFVPPYSHVKIPAAQMMVFGDGYLRGDSRTFLNEIGAITKGTPESYLALLLSRHVAKDPPVNQEAGILIFDFQSSRTVRNTFLLFINYSI